MLRNYIKLAWRNLWKNKAFSAINIFGLTIGLTCCVLIALYLQHELSYDRFQAKGNRIVRMIMEYSVGGSVSKGNYTSTKVAPAFKQNFPEVVSATRMSQGNRIVKYENKLFNEKRFLFADSTFFDLFSFKLLKGNAKYALAGPNVVLVTKSSAQKYFGQENPVGKILQIGSNATPYQVTGVIEDCPSNSQLKFDFLASFSSLGVSQETTYWDANYTTYLLLNDESSISALQSKIPGFMKKEMSSEMTGSDYVTYELEPFQKVHLYSPFQGFEPNNSITYIYIIGAVALLILLIACFTYINLSTARSIERAKEVGIRKVAGGQRKQIFWQFICESFIVSMLALICSILAITIVLGPFNQLSERQLSLASLATPFILSIIFSIIVCISFLAGSYPAFVLSAFQPIKVLKGAFKTSNKGLRLRKSLIVFQFVISIFLIVSTFIIQNQLRYIQTKKLGYNRDHVIVLPIDQKILPLVNTMKTELKSNPEVFNVSRAVNAPTSIVGGYTMYTTDRPEQKYISINANPIDEEFVKTSGLQILAGKDLTLQDMIDVSYDDQQKKKYHYIINETASKALGWAPAEAVGKKLFLGEHRPGIIKAVVKDFHFASLHTPIRPLVLFPDSWSNIIMVKVSGKNLASTVAFLESKWKTLFAHRPFEYHFLDEEYEKLYTSELRIGKVLNIFSGIAILLACLGLFGLSAYTIQQRTKEIGIRKVLGASASKIVLLVSNDFIKLVLLAFLVATPLAWYATQKWLQDFVYRIDVKWWVFAITGALTILIALATVSFQAIKAAISNPVKALRTE